MLSSCLWDSCFAADLPDAAKTLLARVSDPQASVDARIDAIKELGNLTGPGVALALSTNLPGKLDVITMEILQSLAKLKDPAVLPVLLKMKTEQRDEMPDKVNTVLLFAIK